MSGPEALMRSADFARGQFSVALRELEQAAVTAANHPCQYTDTGLAHARRNVFAWLDLWQANECNASPPEPA
jgi:hypothetical protein